MIALGFLGRFGIDAKCVYTLALESDTSKRRIPRSTLDANIQRGIRFLVNLQRLLDEGLFVAPYKFALLLSLADLSVEKGDDSGAQLTLTIEDLAEKFIQYYCRVVRNAGLP